MFATLSFIYLKWVNFTALFCYNDYSQGGLEHR